jgi:simple sugar transport system permease protein
MELIGFLAQAIRISLPYAYASVGACWSERSGVVNIALEGILLNGAFGTAVVTLATGSPWLGLLGGLLAGWMTAALHALVSVTARADQIVSGLAINIAAYGATRMGLKALYGSVSNSPRIPGLPAPSGSGWWGSLAETAGHPLFLLLVAATVLSTWVLFRTGFGLGLRASGERPEAADMAGFPVARLRWIGVMVSGILGGLGGAWLAFHQHSFTEGMSAGRGYIALAAMIVGKWRPWGAAAACLLFGGAEALGLRLRWPWLPTQLLQALPYLATMIVLVVWVGRAEAPAAVGRPTSGAGARRGHEGRERMTRPEGITRLPWWDGLEPAAAFMERALAGIRPRALVVLGSGMGEVARRWETVGAWEAEEIPGYPRSTVAGHAGRLTAVRLGACVALVQQGRVHFYEGGGLGAVLFATRLAHRLGASWLLLTNAAGGLDPSLRPGMILVLEDLVSLFLGRAFGRGPERLSGAPGRWLRGSPFDPGWVRRLEEESLRLQLPARRGILAGGLGPAYETAAEVEAWRRLGAHAGTMSTALEALEGRALGMRVGGLSLITNMATGLSTAALDHEEVLALGREAARGVGRLLERALTLGPAD